MARFDYLIAGAGVAGLSLAVHLVRARPEARLLIVDKNPHDLDQRNLSWWSAEATPFDRFARGSWQELDLCFPEGPRRVELGRYRYRSLAGRDFAAAARGLLAASPGVSWTEGDVVEVADGAGGGAVLRWKGGGEAEGEWAFDGRLLAEEARPDRSTLHLHQRFLGWEITTPDDRFDPAAATFLDFRAPQHDAVRFFYVLPFSPRHALVELVAHDAEPTEELLCAYLAERLGVRDFERLDVESGQSVLWARAAPRRLGRRVLAIGVHGGRLKASTGYAFTRIQRDSERIVSSLVRAGHPFDLPRDRRLYRLLDWILLRVMRRRPERVAAAFQALFANNPIEHLLAFLDEDLPLSGVVRVAASMPRWLFIAEVLRMLVGLPALPPAPSPRGALPPPEP